MRADDYANDTPAIRVQKDKLDSVLALVRACPEAPNWPAEAWNSFTLPEETGLAVRRVLFARQGQDGGFTALIAAALLERTTELELLLVHPAWRRQGVGRQLTEHWLAWGEGAGAREAVLEVRASNSGAQALYRALDFSEQGRRIRYYQRPVEDALLMRRGLDPATGALRSGRDSI